VYLSYCTISTDCSSFSIEYCTDCNLSSGYNIFSSCSSVFFPLTVSEENQPTLSTRKSTFCTSSAIKSQLKIIPPPLTTTGPPAEPLTDDLHTQLAPFLPNKNAPRLRPLASPTIWTLCSLASHFGSHGGRGPLLAQSLPPWDPLHRVLHTYLASNCLLYSTCCLSDGKSNLL